MCDFLGASRFVSCPKSSFVARSAQIHAEDESRVRWVGLRLPGRVRRAALLWFRCRFCFCPESSSQNFTVGTQAAT